jgi:hypothetical protein
MAENDAASIASKSDAELAAMELDKSLPIDLWMAVEKERGRRDKLRRAEAAARPQPTPAPRIAHPAHPTPTAQPAASMSDEDVNVDAALAQLRGLLIPGETLSAYAVQRRLFSLSHRRVIVGATSGRFIALHRGIFGGYTPFDVRWQDLHDVDIRAGAFGATITISSIASNDLGSRDRSAGSTAFVGLRKDQAQRVYQIAQMQEQAWREKRRVRDLDELRAQSGGVQIGAPGGMSSAAGVMQSSTGDPTERLRRAKQMLESGLITDTEYESIKARIVDAL